MEDEIFVVLGGRAHRGAVGRGEGNLADGGEVGFGLDAEFENAYRGLESAGVPEARVGADELVVFAVDDDAESDFAAIAGEVFFRHLAHGDALVKNGSADIDGADGRGEAEAEAGGQEVLGVDGGDADEGLGEFLRGAGDDLDVDAADEGFEAGDALQGDVWAHDGEERSLAAEEVVALVESGVHENESILGFDGFHHSDRDAEVAHLAAARDEAAAIVEADADRGGGGAGGLFIREKPEGVSILGWFAGGAKDIECDAAAQEGFEALDFDLEDARAGFHGGGWHTPEAGVRYESGAELRTNGDFQGGGVFFVEGFREDRAHGDAAVENGRALVEVRKIVGGENDFESIALGLDVAPFEVAQGAAGEAGRGIAACAGLECDVGPGEQRVEMGDALEGDSWLDECEEGGGGGEVLIARLEPHGGEDGLIGGIGEDGFHEADRVAEVAHRSEAGTEAVRVAEGDGERLSTRARGGLGGMEAEPGILRDGIPGNFKMVVGEGSMQQRLHAGNFDLQTALAEAQRGPRHGPEARGFAKGVAVGGFDGKLQHGLAAGREIFLKDHTCAHASVVDGRAAAEERNPGAIDPHDEGLRIRRDDRGLVVALKCEAGLAAGSARLDRVAAHDGFQAGEFGEGNDGAVDPEGGVLGGEAFGETLEADCYGNALEVFQHADGFDGAGVDAAIEEPRFSRVDARRLVEGDFDEGALGGPLGEEKPAGGEGREEGKNPNPRHAVLAVGGDLAVVGFAAGWGVGAHACCNSGSCQISHGL